MTHKSYEEIIECYARYATEEDMQEVARITSEYIEHPYDKHSFLCKVEDVLMPFLCEDKARMYVSEMENADGTHGEHWTFDQIRSSCDRLGLPVSTDRYNEWDMYAAANMMWSDLYDTNKPVEMYIRDAHRYLRDPDFPRPGKMKWYFKGKERLE